MLGACPGAVINGGQEHQLKLRAASSFIGGAAFDSHIPAPLRHQHFRPNHVSALKIGGRGLI